MKKLIFLSLLVFLLVSFARAQVGYFSEELKSQTDSTTIFTIIAANDDTSLVFELVPGPDGFPGSEFPDVINFLYSLASRNDSINVDIDLLLSEDNISFFKHSDLETQTVSGTGDVSVFDRFTNIGGFRYAKVAINGAAATGDTTDVRIFISKEFH